MVPSRSGGAGKLHGSHDILDVRELTGRVVAVADGRAGRRRGTREATADDVAAMIILGQSETVLPAGVVPSLP